MSPSPFPDIESLLPHRGTMLFQDEVKDFTTDTVTCVLRVPEKGWYADENGAMPAWFGLEIMAQAIAAHVALTAIRENRAPKPGALLGSRDFRSTCPAFLPGTELTSIARREFIDDSGLGVYQCQILIGTQEIASAKLKVFEPENFEQFLTAGTQSA